MPSFYFMETPKAPTFTFDFYLLHFVKKKKKREGFIHDHLLNKVKYSDIQRELMEFVSCVITFEMPTSSHKLLLSVLS